MPTASEASLAAWRNSTVRQALQSSLQAQSVPQWTRTPADLEIRIPIRHLDDIVRARRSGRLLAGQMGYSGSREALVLTAISELARNIITYARVGEIVLSRSKRGAREAIVVVAKDQGPGIANVSRVVERVAAGAGSRCGGLGLSSLKLCMDHFNIESRPGAGTRVTCEVLST